MSSLARVVATCCDRGMRVLSLVVLSVALVACGGSKPDPKTPTPAEEKEPRPPSDVDGELQGPPAHEGDVGDPKPPNDDDIDNLKGPGEGPSH